jgi:hypothetical protein
MQLSAFHSDVSRALARGSSLDGFIPGWTRAAAEFIEQTIDFAYMRKFATVALNPAAANPDLVNFPSSLVKKFRFIRYLAQSGAYVYLRGTTPEGAPMKQSGVPQTYWHDGNNTIHLDSKVLEPLTLEVLWLEFTDWPTSLSAEPLLLNRAYNALLSQTLLFAAQDLRDDRLAATYTTRRDDAFRLADSVEGELAFSGTSHSMRFSNAGY